MRLLLCLLSVFLLTTTLGCLHKGRRHEIRIVCYEFHPTPETVDVEALKVQLIWKGRIMRETPFPPDQSFSDSLIYCRYDGEADPMVLLHYTLKGDPAIRTAVGAKSLPIQLDDWIAQSRPRDVQPSQ